LFYHHQRNRKSRTRQLSLAITNRARSIAPDDHDSHEIQALENINSDAQDHDSPHIDNSNECLDHSDVQDHNSPDIDNSNSNESLDHSDVQDHNSPDIDNGDESLDHGDESLDHSDDRVRDRSHSPELQRGGCADLPLYHNSSLVANDPDSSMIQDDSVLVEGYHGTQTPSVFHDSVLWADNPDLYMPTDDFMLGKGSHRTQRSSSTPLLGSLDMSGFRENSLGGESHTEVEHQASTPRPQDQSAVPQKAPESAEPRRSASTPPSQAQSKAPSTIKRKRSETFSPDLFKLDGWLSGDTVTKLLAIVSAGRPASIYAADTSLVVRPRSPFLNKLRSPDLTTVLLPLHLQNHWVLGSVSRDAGNIVLYDSMSTATHSAHAESLIQNYLGDVCRIIDVPGTNDKPTSNDARSPVWLSRSRSLSCLDLHCPSQNNAHDCGVAVIVCAMHAVLGKHLPKWTTYGLWRDVFCVLLTDPTVPIQEDACFAGLLTRHWSTLMPDSEIELAVPPPHFPGTRHRYANLAKMTRELTNFTKKLQDKMDKDRETIRGHIATMSHIRDILRFLHDQMDVENENTDVSRIRDSLRKRREQQESFAHHLTPEELAPLRAVTIHEEERLQSVLDTASDAALRISRAITVVDHHLTELAQAQEALLQA
jgi:hypothetical protein